MSRVSRSCFRLLVCSLAVGLVIVTASSVAIAQVGTAAAGSESPYDRGLKLAGEGKYHDAITYFDEAIDSAPDDVRSLLARAITRVEIAKETISDDERSEYCQQIVDDCDRVLKIDRNQMGAHVVKGVAERLRGELAKADAALTVGLSVAPRNTQALLRRGIVRYHADEKDSTKAMADFKQLIKISPRDPRPHLWRGLLFAREGDLARAIVIYDEALKRNPKFAAALNNRGLAYLKLGDHEKALADFKAWAEVAPDSALAFFRKGVAESELGKHEAAIKSYSVAINNDEKLARAFYNRSVAYEKIDEDEKSVADYQEAARLDAELRDK